MCARPIARAGSIVAVPYLATRVCDGEDRSIGGPFRVFYCQSAFDGGVFCACLGDVTSDDGLDIGDGDGVSGEVRDIGGCISPGAQSSAAAMLYVVPPLDSVPL